MEIISVKEYPEYKDRAVSLCSNFIVIRDVVSKGKVNRGD